MASRSPLLSKQGRREDDDEERRLQKKLEKGKEPIAKDADEESLFDDTKFVVELLIAPSESLKVLARPLTSRCTMMCTRTRA
jgi:hypothetical protein